MRHSTLYAVVITSALSFQAQEAISCSLVRGYFYQVTRLRGRVVGMTNYCPLLGYRSYPSWLRHRMSRDNVKLRLYEYCWPIRGRSETPLVKAVTTDKNGGFDFGSIPVGHYTLVIDWPAIDGYSFEVEIKNLAAETSSVTIDVSPVDPNCKGGHEFMRIAAGKPGADTSRMRQEWQASLRALKVLPATSNVHREGTGVCD